MVLPIEEYERLLAADEDLADLQAADEARAEGGEPIPLEVAEARLRAEGKLPRIRVALSPAADRDLDRLSPEMAERVFAAFAHASCEPPSPRLPPAPRPGFPYLAPTGRRLACPLRHR